MPRKINFFDGVTSEITPTIGNLVASNMITYDSDASYESSEAGAPKKGNFYYNETSCKIRYYDHNNSMWKDSDQESIEAIAQIIIEQGIQNNSITDNAADIDAIEIILNQIQADIISLEDLIKDIRDQDRNIAIVGSGKVSFTSSASGSPVVVDSNTNGSVFTAFVTGVGSGFTFTSQESASVETLEMVVDRQNATVGSLQAELWNTDGSGLPLSLLESSDVLDVSTFNPQGTPTDITFTFNPTSVVNGNKYAIIFVESGLDASVFAQKDDSSTDPDGELLDFNGGSNSWVVSTEARDLHFTLNGTSSSGSSDLVIEDDFFIQIPGLSKEANTIKSQTLQISNGQIAYVELNRTTNVVTNLSVLLSSIENLVVTENTLIIARREDDRINFGVNHTTSLSEGECFKLDEAGSSTSEGNEEIILEVNPAETITYNKITMGSGTTSNKVLDISSAGNINGFNSSILWQPDVALGTKFIAQKSGVYTFSFDSNNMANRYVGFLLNAPDLLGTTNIQDAIMDEYTINMAFDSTAEVGTCTSSVNLVVGDEIKIGIGPTSLSSALTNQTNFTITYHGSIYSGSSQVPAQDRFFIAQHREPFNVPIAGITGLQTRDLNFVDNATTWAVLDPITNIVTVQPGIYKFNWSGFAFYVQRFRNILNDITNTTTYNGKTAFNANTFTGGVGTDSLGDKVLVVNSVTQFTLDTYIQASTSPSALGVAIGTNTGDNINAQLMIEKLGDI